LSPQIATSAAKFVRRVRFCPSLNLYVESGTVRAEAGGNFWIEGATTAMTAGPTNRIVNRRFRGRIRRLDRRRRQRGDFRFRCRGSGQGTIHRVRRHSVPNLVGREGSTDLRRGREWCLGKKCHAVLTSCSDEGRQLTLFIYYLFPRNIAPPREPGPKNFRTKRAERVDPYNAEFNYDWKTGVARQ
jgi:hypothetical protein